MRSGLRQEDVNVLTRGYQSALLEGFGPNEAWARAKLPLRDVEPEVLENWREDVVKAAETGTAATPVTSTNIIDRAARLDVENAKLKRQVAELGAQNEELRGANSEQSEMLSLASKDVGNLHAEIEKMRFELAKVTAERDELILGDPKKKK